MGTAGNSEASPFAFRIGVDLGGTKIEIAVLDERGAFRFRERCPTPRDDYPGTLAAIVEMVGQAELALGGRGSVGVGMPGAFSSRTGLVKNANSTWLNGRAFDRDLAERLGRPVRCTNDANCLAVSEARDGSAAGAGLVFAAILGTGCGAGIAVGGRAHVGPNSIAGEWGHNPLPWPTDEERPGPPCYCGRSGCIETFVSGTGLERDYAHATGHRRTASDIVAGAAAGEAAAESTLRRYEGRLARALAHVVNVLDPDVLVLGGGMSNVRRLYETLPGQLAEYTFGNECDTLLRPAMHGDSSGVRGAAWLWD